MKVKAAANRETGRREERTRRSRGEKKKVFARCRERFKETLEGKVAFIYCFRKKKTTNHFLPLGSGIMVGIAIGDRDDDDSREIKMGDDAESAPLSKNDEGDADRFALREEWSSFGNSGT